MILLIAAKYLGREEPGGEERHLNMGPKSLSLATGTGRADGRKGNCLILTPQTTWHLAISLTSRLKASGHLGKGHTIVTASIFKISMNT